MFCKSRFGLVKGQGANGLHDFASGTHAAGHGHTATTAVSHFAGDLSSQRIELGHAALRVVELEPVHSAAKAVGQNNVSPCVHKILVQFGDAIRVLGVPELRRVARHQADIEQVAAGGTIGQKPVSGGQQPGEAIAGSVLQGGSSYIGHGALIERK